ncbi:hypothetical protein K1T71_014442 [Dendrolimus kikuchii]|uniref:Uncharacterized protein n=1 Tax=Dendrolimus kikuchii TaxID=765133 RepID=A0ACC1CED0_9NEOP|nr:hypothetical protein K1T71_014442 [Dendrolimus kikuchii]
MKDVVGRVEGASSAAVRATDATAWCRGLAGGGGERAGQEEGAADRATCGAVGLDLAHLRCAAAATAGTRYTGAAAGRDADGARFFTLDTTTLVL